MKNNLVVRSLMHAILVGIYVSLVAFVMNHASKWVGQPDTAWTPVAVLMMLVLSATVTGSLVLGKPLLMYIDGQKKEALKLFGYIVGWLFVLTVVVFLVMVAIK